MSSKESAALDTRAGSNYFTSMDVPLSLAELLIAVAPFAATHAYGHQVRVCDEVAVLTSLRGWIERHAPEPAQLAALVHRLRYAE